MNNTGIMVTIALSQYLGFQSLSMGKSFHLLLSFSILLCFKACIASLYSTSLVWFIPIHCDSLGVILNMISFLFLFPLCLSWVYKNVTYFCMFILYSAPLEVPLLKVFISMCFCWGPGVASQTTCTWISVRQG